MIGIHDIYKKKKKLFSEEKKKKKALIFMFVLYEKKRNVKGNLMGYLLFNFKIHFVTLK